MPLQCLVAVIEAEDKYASIGLLQTMPERQMLGIINYTHPHFFLEQDDNFQITEHRMTKIRFIKFRILANIEGLRGKRIR